MSIIQKIIKNTFLLLISQIVSIGFGFVFTMITARYLGTGGFGLLSFALAFNGILGVISDLGLSSLTTRNVSRDNELASTYIGNTIPLKLLLVIINFIFVMIIMNVSKYPSETTKIVYLIALSTIFSAFTNIFTSIFQAFEKMEYTSLIRILNSILMLIGAVIAIKQKFSVIEFASIYFIVNFIILLISSIICSLKFVVFKIEIDWNFWMNSLKESAPFWFASIFAVIYYRIDMVMLSMIQNDAAVGLYAASYRLIDALSVIPSAFMGAMFPIFSKLYIHSKNSMALTFQKAYKILLVLAIPIGIGTTILADKIILIIYGKDYTLSILVLQILIWASVLSFINWTPSTLLNSVNKQRTLMVITLIGTIINILLNFLLIPKMSYVGAAAATVASEFVVGLLMSSYIKNFCNTLWNNLVMTIIKSLTSGLIMGIFLIAFKQYSIFYLIPIAGIIYLICIFYINVFEKEDFILLKNLFKRKSII